MTRHVCRTLSAILGDKVNVKEIQILTLFVHVVYSLPDLIIKCSNKGLLISYLRLVCVSVLIKFFYRSRIDN